jgi:ammonium transporter, Amt family
MAQLGYVIDTLYLLISGALVLWMAAGFAMLEVGLVRAKNSAEILTKNLVLLAVAAVAYLLLGHAVMYPGAAAAGGWWPGLPGLAAALDQVPGPPGQGNRGPHGARLAELFFQMVFAATALSIISGVIAERMRLWPFLLFALVMTGLIYPLQGYWNWGGGFLSTGVDFKDFAGSGTVHLCGAAAALAGVLLLGPRRGKYSRAGQVRAIPGANLPLATLGTFMLWLGWLGFNGGSALHIADPAAADRVALAMVNTNLAACGGVLAALLVARLLFGKADLTMTLNGALAGLVSITAGPLGPTPQGAVLIGAAGGALVVIAIVSLDKLKIDDPVGAISVHGAAGIWGLLAVPLGDSAAHLGAQVTGLAVILAWSFGSALIVWRAIDWAMGLRVGEEDEYRGLDLVECGLEAYPEFVSSRGDTK